MKTGINTMLLGMLMVVISTSFSASTRAQDDCNLIETNTLSLSFTELLLADQGPSEIYSNKRTAIEALAKKLSLAGFKISSGDFSLSRNAYGHNQFEAYMNFYIEFSGDAKAVDSFFKQLNPTSISFSTSRYQQCGGCAGNASVI